MGVFLASLFSALPAAQEVEEPLKSASSLAEVEERLVTGLHGYVPGLDDTLFRWLVCLAIILLAVAFSRLVSRIVFRFFRAFSGKEKGGVDERLFTALRSPVAALFMVCAVYAALKVLRLTPAAEHLVDYGTRVAFTAVALWGILCAGSAVLDHLEKLARTKHIGVAPFMPLVKKTLGVFFLILCVLLLAESMGADVKTFLAGLGIGGLAFALAAQDTIANMFGSFVVVMDRPFQVGDVVRIAGNEGMVEDIGLRSTRLRTAARTLIVIPNKSVATEAITNLSRVAQRRVDQQIGLTYDTTPDQMDAVLADLRALLRADPDVEPGSISVHFTGFGESSLDLQISYFTSDPDALKSLAVRERINLKLMRAVEARGLDFAFPTQTVLHKPA